jgi:outer membrane protein OmpA-like peptidoglycan-associated protein
MKETLTFSFVVAALTAFAVSGAAQNVHDLTGHEPTSDELIKVLKPREGTHRMRGIAPVGPAAKPQCQQRARSRGIAPVSDMAAIKVLFAFNSAELSSEATHTLDELGKALTSSDLKSYCFVVEGHTDNVGGDAYNLKLSERRAQSVVRYLKEHFRIEGDRLQATGYGKRKPIVDNSTEEGRQKNRRVQVANLGD